MLNLVEQLNGKESLLHVRTIENWIHQSWRMNDGKIIAFESVPPLLKGEAYSEQFLSNELNVYNDMKEYLNKLENTDWLNNAEHIVKVSRTLLSYGFPFEDGISKCLLSVEYTLKGIVKINANNGQEIKTNLQNLNHAYLMKNIEPKTLEITGVYDMEGNEIDYKNEIDDENEYGVNIVNDVESAVYYVEVFDMSNNETIKTYDNNLSTEKEAEDFVENVVEKEFNVVYHHLKVLD